VDGEAFKDFEAAGWSANADGYDRLTGRITARVADALLDAAGAAGGVRLLDVGCGPGHLCARAARRGARPIGIDLADGMVELAGRRHPQIEFRRADAEALPFADDSFDAAVGAFVINHLPHPDRGAAELCRVLRPGGRLALAMWDQPERVAWLGLFEQAMHRTGVHPDGALPPGPDAHRFADPAELRSLLERAGLVDVGVAPLTFTVRVDDAGDLWDGVLTGSVRTAAQLRALAAGERDRVRAELGRLLAERASKSGPELETGVQVATGRAG
jgi:SAM-dependent methyltransferase